MTGASAEPYVEIREVGRPPRVVVVDRVLDIGRDGAAVTVTDDGVSRRHLKLLPSPLGLSVVDLGSRNGTMLNGLPVRGQVVLASRNGTMLNGLPVRGQVVLAAGDLLRIGRTDLVVRLPQPVSSVPSGPRLRAADSLGAVPAPPPLVVPPPAPSAAGSLLRRVLRGAETDPVFRTYTELPNRVPVRVWRAVRVASVATYLSLAAVLLIWPDTGLRLFFGVVVPVLPILFFVAPGVWRNICPLSSANQSARVLGFTLGRTAPTWMRERGYLLAMTLFFGIAGARLAVFNDSGTATAALLLVVIGAAFTGGVLFKGKSGWCSSICPLLPVQRLYGQTPFVLSPNSHCRPCLACTRNCFDFQPQLAQQADLHAPETAWHQPRRLFASALPGFVLGFFLLLDRPELSTADTAGRLALFVATSIGAFAAVEAFLGISAGMVTALCGAVALNLFYWFGAPRSGDALSSLLRVGDLSWLRWPAIAVVLPLTLLWLVRTSWAERRYLAETGADEVTDLGIPTVPPRLAPPAAPAAPAAAAEVAFVDGPRVPAAVGQSVLELAEGCGLPIEAGCRMGVCGADPVAILDGGDCLGAPEEDELGTLRRLGLAANTRMACVARVTEGQVRVSLTPEKGGPAADAPPVVYDRSITSVVIVGTGVAGVTTADFVRRGHPECEIHLIGAEPHLLYNRMGISRVVYGRTAMKGLSLLDEQWYDDHRITTWQNTLATQVDLATRRVVLGTGERLFFDRLVLATGSRATTPPLRGFGGPGTFVLRTAEDGARIRAYAQEQSVRAAVVAGGGLLGLEAAHALGQLGLEVTVLERGERLLSRNIDARASELVHQHLTRSGVAVRYRTSATGLEGGRALQQVRLDDGSALPAGIFLAAIGITPLTDLAVAAGLRVDRGIVVDDRMRTSAAGVYAVGDAAQHDGKVLGLWPVAAKQAEVAAANLLGEDERLAVDLPAMILKGVDLDLAAIGRVEPEPGDEVLVEDLPALPSYRRLLLREDVVVGVLVLGTHPEFLAAATTAVKKGLRLDPAGVARVRAGDWLAVKDAR
ncbi:FAD-dependent oxidoreductase [Nocardioides stalactiti]|uniref:FAD-dependent oxidoreductase n=1 Tax=Nocardioides stalactiti TaxID=2755356 RepID=UPI001603D9EB|nr:FAD-dependent oxidoreductase [Nocardioides stalactiti]